MYTLRNESLHLAVTEHLRILTHYAERPTFFFVQMLDYAGTEKRAGDLFGNKSMGARMFNRVSRGVKGVENVYTQHKPLLAETIDLLVKGKLKEQQYPFTSNSNAKEKVRRYTGSR